MQYDSDDDEGTAEKVETVHRDVNLSNKMKMYAKIENNYHLSNKFALFYNMRKYYLANGRDPFEVLPLTYHIKKDTNDPPF